jgi:hypothetical protein
MLPISKILAGVLIAVSATAVFPVIVRSGSAAQMGHTSSCQHEFPVPPAPTDRNHQCCLSGHQWAVPGSAVTLRCVAAERVIQAENTILRGCLLRVRPPAFLSTSPPVNTSLRI